VTVLEATSRFTDRAPSVATAGFLLAFGKLVESLLFLAGVVGTRAPRSAVLPRSHRDPFVGERGLVPATELRKRCSAPRTFHHRHGAMTAGASRRSGSELCRTDVK